MQNSGPFGFFGLRDRQRGQEQEQGPPSSSILSMSGVTQQEQATITSSIPAPGILGSILDSDDDIALDESENIISRILAKAEAQSNTASSILRPVSATKPRSTVGPSGDNNALEGMA
ncbi:hypothetical protein EV182_007266, partial [Spiromyces aspiralis]